MTAPRKDIIPGIYWRLLALFAGAYCLLYGLYFLADPLGQVPVLDARENVVWAELIRGNALPAEPIYRALLYPWVLSWLPNSLLPAAATLFGLVMHGASALLVVLIAGHLWKNAVAARLAGFVYAVYPVALYFAGQLLDITFATTLFLFGIYSLLVCTGCEGRRKTFFWALTAGLVGGLAVLARPNFLPAVLCLPLAVFFFQIPRRVVRSALVAAGVIVVLGFQGGVNYKLSGEIRILPWQGAYNLYAANKTDANGKYYAQQVYFDRVEAGKNTNRMESEWLYREAVGAHAPQTITAMNAHWRERLLDEVLADPLRWFGLMSRKLVYALNNWEQYNNLTYAYHKERWPYLRWNPLGWGILMIAATCGLIMGFSRANRPALCALGLVALAYFAGLLLFFVSARFRLPLAPLLCVAVGGCAFIRQLDSGWKKLWLGVSSLLIGVASFGNWFEAQDRKPFLQDELLLAQASSQVGDDTGALRLARAVLQRDPERPGAQRLEATSLFNLWLSTGETVYWGSMAEALRRVDVSSAGVEFIRGVYDWRSGRRDRAVRTWETAVERYGEEADSALAALRVLRGEEDAALNPVRKILGL